MSEFDAKDIFVKVEDPKEFRTSLLETARLSTFMLKNKDKLLEIKKQKIREKNKLNIVISDLKVLINSFELKDFDAEKPKEELKKAPIKFSKIKEKIKIEKDQLTLDLEEIERKLNNLKI